MRPGLFEGFTHIETLSLDAGPRRGALREFSGYPDAPPVFAAAFFGGLIEWACIKALEPFLETEERTFGTRIALSSETRAPAGSRITTIVEVARVKDGAVAFMVRCRDSRGVIAEGAHTRAVLFQAPAARARETAAAC